MEFAHSSARPYDELKTVGLAIRWDAAHSQAHIGVLHRLDKDVQLCHLLFHERLRRDPPEEGYFWDDCSMFVGTPERLLNGRLFAALVSDSAADPRIPYGFAFDTNCFGHDGRYRPMEIGKGLTCATFVIALFHSAGFPIMRLETWKERPDDAEWQQKILEPLKRYATAEHVAAVEASVGQFRYRPEEVAAAGVTAPEPLNFDDCAALAAELFALISATRT